MCSLDMCSPRRGDTAKRATAVEHEQHGPWCLIAKTGNAPQPDEEDVEVRLEDQRAINTFGRLNTRMHELEEELKEKRSQYDQIDDASNEIILADDDEPIRHALREGGPRGLRGVGARQADEYAKLSVHDRPRRS